MATNPVLSVELDPIFVKALKLLQSNSADAGEKLRSMVYEVLNKKSTALSKTQEKISSNANLSKKETDLKKTDTEKLNSEKHRDNTSISGKNSPVSKSITTSSQHSTSVPAKRVKLDNTINQDTNQEKDHSKEKSHEKSKEGEKPKLNENSETEEKAKVDSFIMISDSESTDEETDTESYVMDMGVCCDVCHSFEASNGNQLVECQECHTLYHQECHRPPVTEAVNDPRFVWYCSKCQKNMKKMVSKTSKPKAPTLKEFNFLKPPSSTKAELSPPTSVQPFKRPESKNSSNKEPSPSSAAKPFSGLAGLADKYTTGSSSKSEQKSFKTDAPLRPVLSKPPNTSSTQAFSGLSKLASAATGGKSVQSSKAPPSTSFYPLGKKTTVSLSASAANSSITKSASTGTLKSTSSSSNTSVIISADKRLQLMKKKAANKQIEKRNR